MTTTTPGAAAPSRWDFDGFVRGLQQSAAAHAKSDRKGTADLLFKAAAAIIAARQLATRERDAYDTVLAATCRSHVKECEQLQAQNARLTEALRFYANPQIYKPHPDGPAFDRRDLSYAARNTLKEIGDE